MLLSQTSFGTRCGATAFGHSPVWRCWTAPLAWMLASFCLPAPPSWHTEACLRPPKPWLQRPSTGEWPWAVLRGPRDLAPPAWGERPCPRTTMLSQPHPIHHPLVHTNATHNPPPPFPTSVSLQRLGRARTHCKTLPRPHCRALMGHPPTAQHCLGPAAEPWWEIHPLHVARAVILEKTGKMPEYAAHH